VCKINDQYAQDNKSKLFEQVTLGTAAVFISQRAGTAVYNQQTYQGKDDHYTPYNTVAPGFANQVATHTADIGCKE
jgi:hypothetical protein